MRSPSAALLPLLRTRGLSRTGAWIVALAILLQIWVGVPLAMRMTHGATAPHGDTITICTAEGSVQVPAGEPDSGTLPAHYDHQNCLLCQGGIGPLLVAAACLLAALPAVGQMIAPALPALLTAQDDTASYQSRAPPVGA
jgi:hypothetical protein